MIENWLTPISNLLSWANQSSGWVTAFATVALAFLTLALVIATNRLVQAGSSANVIASIEPNKWSLMHMDLVI
ncbi:MAG: hypothetical protein RIC24_01335 [Hyphomicrobiales bacterium]|jgi:hypothetical protein